MGAIDNGHLVNLIIWVMAGGGLVALIAGILTLILNVFSRDMISAQKNATRLAEKGFNEDISGSLGNASFLIKELNTLIETKRGIGMALVIIGGILLLVSLYFLTK